jgi:drug/metabolite transporter (DMT)-like permease
MSFLLKQRGAVSAPPVRIRHPLRSATGLFRSRWFAVGWMVAVGAWALHVGALALAPLSVVQAVLAAGLVFLAVLAERFFGFRLGRRQWIGLTITAIGLAIIGITQGAQPSEPPGYALAALITIEGSVLLLATGLAVVAGRLRVLRASEGLLLGVAAGALFGVSDIALKFLTHAVQDGVLELISPWTFAALAASVIAFYASARGLQIGPGVEVIALTSVAANLVAIVGGVLIFRDSIGIGAAPIAGRMAAFGMVIAGAALIPAPVRAADTDGERDQQGCVGAGPS